LEVRVLIFCIAIFILYVVFLLPASFEEKMSDPCRFAVTEQTSKTEKCPKSSRALIPKVSPLTNVHLELIKPEQDPDFNKFEELQRPAIPYFFYELALWFGVVWPIFISVIRSARSDITESRLWETAFNQHYSAELKVNQKVGSHGFDELVTAYHNRVTRLIKRAQCNLSVILILLACFLLEYYLDKPNTALQEAVDIGKKMVWLLLLPPIAAFVRTGVIGHRKATLKMNEQLRYYMDSLTNSHADSELLNKVRVHDDQLVWTKHTSAFVISVAKSNNVIIPIALLGAGAILDSMTGGSLINIFAPSDWVNFGKSILAPGRD